MGKDPAFLFYPGDWLGGTLGMTFEEKGAYIDLLMLQFNRGHMTKHMIGQTVGRLWDNIAYKFKVDSKGLYYNKRLEIEQKKRKKYTESRRNNVLGKNQYSKTPKKEGGHMTYHMEDEDVNEYKIENKDINEIINYLIDKQNLKSLDGEKRWQEKDCKELIHKISLDYPDSDPIENIKLLIDLASQDKFHSKNLTSIKYLKNNVEKIKRLKGKTDHDALEEIKRTIAEKYATGDRK